MTQRRGDQEFAVVTQSVTGGRGRGPNRIRGIGVIVVVVAAIALIGVGLLGPRLGTPPNFDVSYFATPIASVSPTPTPTFPNRAPTVTPLPVLTQPEGVGLDGRIAIAGDAIRYLDLGTGTTTRILPMELWRDAVFRTGDDSLGCICIEDNFQESGPVRIVNVFRIQGEEVTKRELTILKSTSKEPRNQPDPLVDVDLGPSHLAGMIATATQLARDQWRVAIRPVTLGPDQALGPETVLGKLVVPKLTPAPSPTPSPVGAFGPGEDVYLDGPHVRVAPDGRSAFVWASAQRYFEDREPLFATGAWTVSVGSGGGPVENVTDAQAALGPVPYGCSGWSYAATDRLVAICAESPDSNGSSSWAVKTFEPDGSVVTQIALDSPGDFGYGEPLIDRANGQLFLWDAINLRIVRVDIRSGRVDTTAFDGAAETAPGPADPGAFGTPSWHDTDSAVQQQMWEQIAGSADGSRLYAVGIRPINTSDSYGQASLGIFVIDRGTLALVDHWAPAASDAAVKVLPDGRVAAVGQPGFNAAGEQVPWEGSITLRDGQDGRILARYGRVSTDMAPVIIGQ